MRLNPAAFDRFLEHIGQQVQWRRSFSCACTSPTTGQPDPKHALCGGKGRIWDPPVDTVVGVANQKVQAEWAKMGLWEAGDTVLSVPQSSKLWDAGRYDRILMLNSDDVFSMPLVRAAPSEKLSFQPLAVTRCFWLHPTTKEILEGSLPTFGADGRPVWAAGSTAPPAGTTYSVTGTKRPEYYIWQDWPGDRNQHSGARLPKRVIARKFDLFAR